MDSLDKVQVLDEFFRQKVWFVDCGDSRRIVGVSIKVEPNGYLAIIKAISPEGPQVAFLGKKSLDKIRTALLSSDGRGALRWRIDEYQLDKK